jgi:molybdopterin-containing oxidoreductase family iron-sulfur binding subunit
MSATDVSEYQRLREQLASLGGQAYWRGLEALAETPEAQALIEAEFPGLAPTMDRRRFLQLMGASLAMAGLVACGKTPEEAVPQVTQSPEQVPGVPLFYATAISFAGYAQPLLAKTHGGRPVKLEGNPQHPVSGGSCDAFTQATLLQLYDPDRSKAPRFKGRETSWPEVHSGLTQLRNELDRHHGAGLHLVLGASSSPTLQGQLRALRTRWPQVRIYQGECFAGEPQREAQRQVFGRAVQSRVHLEQSEVVVSFEHDLLGPGPLQNPQQRAWAQRRRQAAQGQGSARLFVAEAVPSLTGAAAEQRVAVAPDQLGAVLTGLARRLGEPVPAADALPTSLEHWLNEAATALLGHPSRSLITVGPEQPAAWQAMALRLNQRLGAVGGPLTLHAPVLIGDQPDAPWLPFTALQHALQNQQVKTLLIMDCNPLYNAPLGFDMQEAMQQVPLRVHAGLYYDESAAQCHWHLPLSHALESWGDSRALDGSACLQQPLVQPLYATRSAAQVVALLLDGTEQDGQDLLRQTWGDLDQTQWRQALERGVASEPTPLLSVAMQGQASAVQTAAREHDDFQVVVLPDPCIWDGRFANLGWLQELPKPISKLTWSNVIGIAPAVAEQLGVRNGDTLEVLLPREVLRGPAWVEPGQAPGVIALYAGYGRSRAGQVGNGLGYHARPLPVGMLAGLRKGEGHSELASTQAHHQMADQAPIRRVDKPTDHLEKPEPNGSFYPAVPQQSPQWGMVIDLDACTGCNACVVACQAENNIAVVGAEQVAAGRSMHWLRIDHYYQGDLDAPRSAFQPVPCMHCENAPCETGCPVNATQHSSEGLNQMVYNRCIGTRTCASFCPYKVRRFNWFDYSAEAPPSVQAQRNPEVTVRSRGVMEKCSYCVQRISAARIEAKAEGRDVQDGEVKTACQQTCASQAIQFGDISNPQSPVSLARQSGRHYSLLAELNTRPRTTYLARIDSLNGEGDDER